jgi:hypothetical protein
MKELTIHDKALLDYMAKCDRKDAEIKLIKALLREFQHYGDMGKVAEPSMCTAVKEVLV